MNYRIEVRARQPASRLPTNEYGAERAEEARLFFIGGEGLTLDHARTLAEGLLADPVTEDYTIARVGEMPTREGVHTIEVTPLPGVTDAEAASLLWAAHVMGIREVARTATGRHLTIFGELEESALRQIAEELLANTVIQRYSIDAPIDPPFVPAQPPDDTVEVIAVRELDDAGLEALSAERRLALNLDEMRAIQLYYREEERDPTDAELETLAQTWSEHCVHKTFKARITYTGPLPGTLGQAEEQHIGSLLGDYIRAATDALDRDWVVSAFVDNAGIVRFNDELDLAFKVETHNHPSALEPFGGANTGVGGVVRDVLGVSAKPIANTDVLCFGTSDVDLPEGVLPPERIERGVIAGIEDYGNKMGIPTVNGSIHYDPGYIANPLVYCGCLGVLPHGSHPTDPQPGDLIVVLGGRTGRDGLRGATFSSMEMDEATAEIAGTAVQIGDPINEKQVQEVILQARDERLYNAITDCGAGGLSSAVGEMGEAIGAHVELTHVPLKYPGLRPWEIWLSEAQERMVLAVPPESWPRLQAIAERHGGIEAVTIGTFEPTGRLRLTYNGTPVGDLAMHFLHDGLPPRHMLAEWAPPARQPLSLSEPADLTPSLLELLRHPNIRSNEATVRVYDHEVQGGTAVKPLVGVDDHGPGDASAVVPLDGLPQGERTAAAVLSNGINPAYGALDPYAMAWAAVDEALRNAVAVGANPDRIAILDNFCWGNPNLPDRLGALVRCAQGCYDAALAYRTPFVSGKDSLNNEYTAADGTRHAIPGTLLISALGIVHDVNQTVTSDFKQAGSLIVAVGTTREELGGSHYALLHDDPGGVPPQPVEGGLAHLRAVYAAIRSGVVLACHDCSEGGLAVALAEMCIGGRLGAEVDLVTAPGAADHARSDTLLFSESLTRFLIEVAPADLVTLNDALAGVPHAHIGRVTADGSLTVRVWEEEPSIDTPISQLEEAWRGAAPAAVAAPPSAPAESRREAPAALSSRPPIAILHAPGTNRDRDAWLACTLAGGDPRVVLVNEVLRGTQNLLDYAMLVVPGGFSYGDDLGAGQIWATTLMHDLGGVITQFVEEGRPTLGICNGFQVLVKAGILPGGSDDRSVTLTYNAGGRFVCRWVTLLPEPVSVFTRGLTQPIHCPVAHGEGRIAVQDDDALAALEPLIALRYAANPNGSADDIAGLTNAAGTVLGLMPHPEDHIFPWQHPRRHRGEAGGLGLHLFENGVRAAAGS